ncbi:MAG TPA: flagellar hook-length control protein FliK [Pyrinomonadaceae bacterium]|nr:flagellar hook-length control protein FliK [Pyrinomonadaceae bacterium]
MKIPTTPHVPAVGPRPSDDANKPSARKSASSADATHADEPAESAGAAGRDFASVLEEVARPRERTATKDEGEGEQFESKSRESVEGEPEARRREGREGGEGSDTKGGGGFDQRGGVREVLPAQGEAGARSILHIADLERIVSAVRAQTLAGGAREITIELRRSVLEGLKVKLSLDGAGRVAAELIAASERVRAQLDARTGELAEILRSRGVNLASLSTSVGADASGQNARGAQDFGAVAAAANTTTRDAHLDAADEGDDASVVDDGTTYRA